MTKIKENGFSLLELMIVITIIGIIAAIAIPSYQDNVKKGRRADAKAALSGFAAALERQHGFTGTYLGLSVSGNTKATPIASLFPNEAPIEGDNKYYDLRFTFTTQTYTVYALPKNGQADDGPFLLKHTGEKGWAKGEANTAADSDYTSNWK